MKEILDLLQSMSIILAAVMAAYGLDAWRREFIGKRKMELAEEVLALALETKEIIAYVRSPGGFEGEGGTRQASQGEPEDVRRARDLAFVPIERENRHLEKLNRLWALSYRFRAQFSDREAEPIERLRGIFVKIKTSCHILATMWPLRGNAPNEQVAASNAAICREHEAVIWESYGTNGTTPDAISLEVVSAVDELTGTCRSVLESKRTLFGLMNRRVL